jgi:hypothetical protein
MRKHKSVVAILLAVMMIFTFMPTMAFAQSATGFEAWKFSDDYSQIISKTDENIKYNTEKVWNDAGYVTIKISSAYGDVDPSGFPVVNYYDLAGATFAEDETKDIAQIYDSGFNKNRFNGVKVTRPSDVAKGSSTKDTVYVAFATMSQNCGVWTYAMQAKVDGKDYETSQEDQTVEVSLKQTWTAQPNPAEGQYLINNAPAAVNVTVNGSATSASDAEFYLDAAPSAEERNYGYTSYIDSSAVNATLTKLYDGAEHTVVMNKVKGYGVTYEVFNPTTGKWDKKDPVTVKNVSEEPIQVRATVADTATGKKTKVYTFNVNMAKVYAPTFKFVHQGNKKIPAYDNVEFNAKDWIEVVPYSWSNYPVYNSAVASAVKADEAQWLAFFDDFYEITVTPGKIDPSTADLSFKAKSMTNAERTELVKKHEALLDNYNTNMTGYPYGSSDTAESAVVVTNTDYEVTFTEAITAKTYKGSKTTKKGKLKKNQTIQFTAEAANGATVKYKLVDVNTSKIKIDSTGKVTVKKNLAKGTYKFKVKAYVPNVKDAYEVQNVTIKIKK